MGYPAVPSWNFRDANHTKLRLEFQYFDITFDVITNKYHGQ